MEDKKCKHCNKEVKEFPHYCEETHTTYTEDDSDKFLISMVMGMAIDNGIVGGIIGGDLLGGVVGDLLNDGDLF